MRVHSKMLVFSLAVIVAVVVFDGCARTVNQKDMVNIPIQDSPSIIGNPDTGFSLSIVKAVDSRLPNAARNQSGGPGNQTAQQVVPRVSWFVSPCVLKTTASLHRFTHHANQPTQTQTTTY